MSNEENTQDIILNLSGPVRSQLVVTGGIKFLMQDFKDKNGVLYSIACPNVLVKMHDKEDKNGESGDQRAGSEEENSTQDQSVEEGSTSDNVSES